MEEGEIFTNFKVLDSGLVMFHILGIQRLTSYFETCCPFPLQVYLYKRLNNVFLTFSGHLCPIQ